MKINNAPTDEERQYEELIDNVPQVIWICSPDGQCSYVNYYAEKYAGVPAERLLGWKWLEYIHPEDREQVKASWMKAVQTGSVFGMEYRVRNGAGQYRWARAQGIPLYDKAGQIVKWIGLVIEIDDQKHMEETLRQQEERFRLVADSAGILVFDVGINLDKTDPIFHFPEIKINAVHGLPELLGYSPEEVPLTLAWMISLIHPEDVSEFVRLSQEGFKVLKDLTLHYRLRHKDGHYLNVEEISRIVWDANGRPVRLVGGIRDMTARMTMEVALRESEEKFRILSESANLPIGIIQGRKFVYANSYLINLSGYTPEEFYALDILQLVHPDYREMIADRYRRRIMNDPTVPTRYEYKMITKSGEERWMDVAPVRIDLNGIPSIIGNAVDVTDRKRVEDALRESEEKFRILSESANLPVGIIQGRKFVYANPYLLNLSGYTPEEFYSLDFLQLVHPDFWATIIDGYSRGMRSDPTVPTRFEYKMITKSGEERWMDLSPIRIDLKGIPSVIGSAIDVTDRKRTEEALREAKAELELRIQERTAELQRSNEDLEKFAYVASHDLQEPLRMVGMYVGKLAHIYRNNLDSETRECIKYAIEGATRMSRLIKDVMEYSRINTQGKKPEEIDIQLVLDMALKNLKLIIEQTGAQITHGSLPTVAVDDTQLVQVFQNLIGNAIKFRRETETPKVQISAERVDRGWLFSVQDNGIGIDPEFFERIFVAFQRLQTNRDKFPGSGIGLAIVKRIIERHGGHICVESTPGLGSIFYFTLPAK